MADRIGQQIGNYRLIAELASGGFGSVYLAQHSILSERSVAIKLLHTSLPSIQEREQFLQEARFLERLKRSSPLRLPEEEALVILSQIGQALHYAHQHNVIHRDLKPENILFNNKGEALLADFGLAMMLANTSMQQIGEIGGTPPYMAPEQFQGTISKESDQYALGCIAYELYTGQQPFSASNFLAWGFKHVTEQPLAPSQLNPMVPAHIERAILTALAKQRRDRYADIAAFVAALTSPPPPGAALTSFPQEEDIPTVPSSPLSHTARAGMLAPGLSESYAPAVPSSHPSPELSLPPTPPTGGELSREEKTSTDARHGATKRSVPGGQRAELIVPKDQEEKVHVWRLTRKQLPTMFFGILLYVAVILCGERFLHISLTRGAWFYQLNSSISSICLWCLLVTLACFFGARFGPWVGLIPAAAGYFTGAYLSYITSPGISTSLGQYINFYYLKSSSFDTTGYPILTGYFNLSLALIAFVAGLALLKTHGRYTALRFAALAEGLCVLGAAVGGAVVLLFLVAWRGPAEMAVFIEVSMKLLLSILPALILLPFLLILYDRIIALRKHS
jgi:hypothetical protein